MDRTAEEEALQNALHLKRSAYDARICRGWTVRKALTTKSKEK